MLAGGEENWNLKPAQVYTTLARLNESGLVAEESVEKDAGPEKRIYGITQTGRDELQAWFTTAVIDEQYTRRDVHQAHAQPERS